MRERNSNYIICTILSAIAAMLCVSTLVLLFASTKLGTVYLKTSGNPEETICYFYECIEQGNYADAYNNLAEYCDLGLESNDAEGSIINDALKKSYKCQILNNVEVDGLLASAEVEFTYLDLATLQEKLEEGINPILEQYIEELEREELYDESGDYRQDFLQMVYDETLEKIIKKDESIYKTATYKVDMQYVNDGWKILTNKDMIKCFLGGRTA